MHRGLPYHNSCLQWILESQPKRAPLIYNPPGTPKVTLASYTELYQCAVATTDVCQSTLQVEAHSDVEIDEEYEQVDLLLQQVKSTGCWNVQPGTQYTGLSQIISRCPTAGNTWPTVATYLPCRSRNHHTKGSVVLPLLMMLLLISPEAAVTTKNHPAQAAALQQPTAAEQHQQGRPHLQPRQLLAPAEQQEQGPQQQQLPASNRRTRTGSRRGRPPGATDSYKRTRRRPEQLTNAGIDTHRARRTVTSTRRRLTAAATGAAASNVAATIGNTAVAAITSAAAAAIGNTAAANNAGAASSEHAAGNMAPTAAAAAAAAAVPIAAAIRTSSGRKRSAAAAQNAGRQGEQANEFKPNDPTAPLSQWSLSISGNGTNVPVIWLDRTYQWMQQHDMRGAATLERGTKKHRLHIQGVFETHAVINSVRQLSASLRAFIPITAADAAKIILKPLNGQQSWTHMIGYIQKDVGQSHYRMVHHQLTHEELEAGTAAYAEVSMNYEKGKINITRANLGRRIYAFWLANFSPFIISVDVLLLHMIASGRYVPSHSWLTAAQGRTADLEMVHVWMYMICRPEQVTLDMIRELFFGSHIPRYPFRYFRTGAVSDRVGLTDDLKVGFEKVEQHADDMEGVRRVCKLLLGYMQQNAWDMKNVRAIDALFAEAFDDVYYSTGGPPVPPLQVPNPAEDLDEDVVLGHADEAEQHDDDGDAADGDVHDVGISTTALGARYRVLV